MWVRALRWLAIPAGFGLLSLLLGQDANWDLRNYHRYNPYAWLSGRVGVDLAPAGMQSYFNPLLDLPAYWMGEHLPPLFGGFAMGAFQGLAVVLLAWIGRAVLPLAAPAPVSLWLALAGGFSATFFSGIGNGMGDNVTAVLMLLALALVLWHWDESQGHTLRQVALEFALAGFIGGLATGLKLTNAPLAVGLAATTLWHRRSRRDRLTLLVAACAGIAAGVLVTGGYWHWRMWQLFGNPLFPQFNNLFHAPLASEVGIVDTRWRPRSLFEALTFPFAFTSQPNRIHELKIVQILWPVAYALVVVSALVAAASRVVPTAAGRDPDPKPSPAFSALLVFLCVSYLTWMLVFSIGRYMVALEMLLPLVTWILLRRFLRRSLASLVGVLLIGASVLVTIVRAENWGYSAWSERRYSVQVPPELTANPDAAVLLAGTFAWIIPDLPQGLVFISLARFPESKAYREAARSIAAARPRVYVLVEGVADVHAFKVRNLNMWTAEHHIIQGDWACNFMEAARQASPRYRHLQLVPTGGSANAPCAYEIPPAFLKDVRRANLDAAIGAGSLIEPYGFRLSLEACRPYSIAIGASTESYQLCEARVDAPHSTTVPSRK